MTDEYDLQRFLDAQEDVYEDALAMLRRGAMCTPYMDFIFPRMTGEDLASRFAIVSLDEARALLAFPLLGNRYRECVESLPRLVDTSPDGMFGRVDARKLQASLTLFAEATNEPMMRTVLAIWFDNLADEETLVRIGETA
ncbi:DUF1810 domain-containing protein [Sphingosinicella sp. CPCC 101087]|uniref:DUF1810 domain-containing protein n=1 Tax=Sphingosinicella sp. CPCC 101087 TaxID=2497754 RepID=UPI00101D7061|nr:DUF1810 family protein [Sphingosinicella sp. CPCC 101087]